MASVGVLTLEMRFEHAHSLKDKRHFIRGLKDRLRAGHNLAVSEIDYQDLWQSGLVAAVTVSPSRERAQQVLQAAEETAAAFLGPCLVAATVEWLA